MAPLIGLVAALSVEEPVGEDLQFPVDQAQAVERGIEVSDTDAVEYVVNVVQRESHATESRLGAGLGTPVKVDGAGGIGREGADVARMGEVGADHDLASVKWVRSHR